MTEDKKAKKVMDQATDAASEALEGVQNATEVTDQFNAEIDKASELASAKYQKNR